MRDIIKIFSIGLCILFLGSCDKSDEVPPRSEAFINEYVLPAPEFLSVEEREIIRKQREEYNKL